METEQRLKRLAGATTQTQTRQRFSNRETKFSPARLHSPITAQVRLGSLPLLPHAAGAERWNGQRAFRKGQQRKKKGKKKKVLTTPVSDLVFRSSFTSPKPVGVETDREAEARQQLQFNGLETRTSKPNTLMCDFSLDASKPGHLYIICCTIFNLQLIFDYFLSRASADPCRPL